jgi:hypothetical protein
MSLVDQYKRSWVTEQEIREMKVGSVFLHPFHMDEMGEGLTSYFVITEIGPETNQNGKILRLMSGERWTRHEYEDLKFYGTEKIWADYLYMCFSDSLENFKNRLQLDRERAILNK